MRKFLCVAMLVLSIAMFGCGNSEEQNGLLSTINVNTVLDDCRSHERDIGYEIHDVKYGENNGEHFCSAVFDKNGRGSIYFTVTEKGEIISTKISMTEAIDYNLDYQGSFVLTRVLFSAGLTQDEIQKCLQEQSEYLNAELAKQQNSGTPTIDKDFIIQSSKLNKKIVVHVKANEHEKIYTAKVAQ